MSEAGLLGGEDDLKPPDHITGILIRRPHMIPSLVAIAALVGAVGAWPYWYYQLLRWVVLACATFAGVVAYKRERWWAVVVMGAVAVLFNPLAPIHLSKGAWQWLDPVGAAVFVSVSLFIPSIKGTPRKELLALAALIMFAVAAGGLLAWSVGFGTAARSYRARRPVRALRLVPDRGGSLRALGRPSAAVPMVPNLSFPG